MPHRSRCTCVLVSGGLDSAVLLHRMLAGPLRGSPPAGRLLPLYLRCGFIWEAAELHWVRRFLKAGQSTRLLPLQVIDVPLRSAYGEHWSMTGRRVPGSASADEAVYLPGRNVLLLTHAAIVCAERGISTIALGILRGNPFGDASPRFFRQLTRCLTSALDHPIRVLTPLARSAKAQLVRSASDVPLGLTFSCLRPRGRLHCGRCNKCAERRRAFRAAGIVDPTRYAGR